MVITVGRQGLVRAVKKLEMDKGRLSGTVSPNNETTHYLIIICYKINWNQPHTYVKETTSINL